MKIKRILLTDKEQIRKVELIWNAVDAGQRSREACRHFGIDHATYCAWKRKHHDLLLPHMQKAHDNLT